MVILDVNMPGVNGLNVLKEIKALDQSPEVIMLSSEKKDNLVIDSVKAGAFWYLEKNCDLSEIVSLIEKALSASKLSKNNDELKASLSSITFEDKLITNSQNMKEVIYKARQISNLDSNYIYFWRKWNWKIYTCKIHT